MNTQNINKSKDITPTEENLKNTIPSYLPMWWSTEDKKNTVLNICSKHFRSKYDLELLKKVINLI